MNKKLRNQMILAGAILLGFVLIMFILGEFFG